jgi:Tol biopolymer transport system component
VRARWREPALGERESGERSWSVVRAAFAEREPVPRSRARWPIVVAAAGAAVVAAALSPPGLAVLGSIRDAVRGEPNAKPGLFSLPAAGRLLVNSDRGVWVVHRDGSKRLLMGYRDASWSPRGLYVAAVHNQEVRALEADGDVHWSLARQGSIRVPRWSYEGFRIAYFADGALRVVNGDGTGDRLLKRDVRPGVSAWEPASHTLAYLTRAGNIALTDVDRPGRTAVIPTRLSPRQLEWTPDGRLVAVGTHVIAVFSKRGTQLRRVDRGTDTIAAASLSPDGGRVAFVETNGNESRLLSTETRAGSPRQIFKGAGTFAGVFSSPDGRWLVLDWSSADQWLFIRAVPVRRIIAVSNITESFGANASIVGWCCP